VQVVESEVALEGPASGPSSYRDTESPRGSACRETGRHGVRRASGTPAGALRARGFTLIELMIVVAITGILSLLALSAYQTYTIRAQVAEGISLVGNAKTPIVDAFIVRGDAPADRVAAGMSANATDTQGNYVASVDVENGRLDVTFGNLAHAAIAGQVLSLTPYETVALDIVWICGGQTPGLGLNPMGFTGGGNQTVPRPTTIEPRYLPATCR
jgi:type IV pilus assembly protein PilA